MGTTRYSAEAGMVIYGDYGAVRVVRSSSKITVYTDGYGTGTIEPLSGNRLRVTIPNVGTFTANAHKLKNGVRLKGTTKNVEFTWEGGKLNINWSGFGTLVDGASAALSPKSA